MAFPCATQNELDEDDAQALIDKGCWAVIEGANMPTTGAGAERLMSNNVIYVPGKMANAGGVAVSGLEMSQNRTMLVWNGTEVNAKLKEIMIDIYQTSKNAAKEYDVDLGAGANIAAFLKVSEAMYAQGCV